MICAQRVTYRERVTKINFHMDGPVVAWFSFSRLVISDAKNGHAPYGPESHAKAPFLPPS